MGRPELGTKCTCTGCNERFYDLNRTPAICPKCGVQQRPAKPRSPRPSHSTIGAGLQPRRLPRVVNTEDDVEPSNALEIAADADELDPDDEASDDVADDDDDVDPGVVKPVD